MIEINYVVSLRGCLDPVIEARRYRNYRFTEFKNGSKDPTGHVPVLEMEDPYWIFLNGTHVDLNTGSVIRINEGETLQIGVSRESIHHRGVFSKPQMVNGHKDGLTLVVMAGKRICQSVKRGCGLYETTPHFLVVLPEWLSETFREYYPHGVGRGEYQPYPHELMRIWLNENVALPI